jgi:hypothetical protein
MRGFGLPRGAYVVDTEVGFAWGAPYAAQKRFGALLMTGAEWFAGVGPGGSPNANLASVAWLTTLGARWTATRTGPLALWVGLDGRGRFARQRIGSPLNYSLFPVNLLLVVGGFVLVDR